MSNKMNNSPSGRRTQMSLSASINKTAGNSHKVVHAVHANNGGSSGSVNGVSAPNAGSKGDKGDKNQHNKSDAGVIDLTKEFPAGNAKKSVNTAENKKEKDKAQNGVSGNKAANSEQQTINMEQNENINKTEQVVVTTEAIEAAAEVKVDNKNNEKEGNLKAAEKPIKEKPSESKADSKGNSIERQLEDAKNNDFVDINNSKKAVELGTTNREGTPKIVMMEVAKERTPTTPTSKKTRSSSVLSSVGNSPTKPLNSNSPIKSVNANVESCTPMVVVENNVMDASPKKEEKQIMQPPTTLPPTATSTPGKFSLQKRNVAANLTEVQLSSQSCYFPERPQSNAKITGRRSIHCIKEYTPSKNHNDAQYAQSYRRINTEFDDTNSSLNVTVGSTLLDDSLSSFYLGRKRERTLNAEDEQANMVRSPPKKARMDIFGLFYSPITMLRNRLCKTSLKNSTPVNLEEQFQMFGKNDVEVQNVSGISVEENDEVASENDNDKENFASDNQAELDDEILKETNGENLVEETDAIKSTNELDIQNDDEMLIEVKEVSAKQRKCIIM